MILRIAEKLTSADKVRLEGTAYNIDTMETKGIDTVMLKLRKYKQESPHGGVYTVDRRLELRKNDYVQIEPNVRV